jgi:hypothetical protein
MNLTTLIRKGHLVPVTSPDRHGVLMLTGWKRKPNSRKRGEWTLKKPTVWIDRLAIMRGKALLPGAQIVKDERDAHFTRENWTTAHDDDHDKGELADAAACYALDPADRKMIEAIIPGSTRLPEQVVQVPRLWPWSAEWWKPSEDRIRDLAKAGALYLAEADRLKRVGKEDEAAKVEQLAIGCAAMIDAIYGV